MLVAAPILIPLVTAALAMAFHRSVRVQRLLGVTGSFALLAAAIALLLRTDGGSIDVLQMGNWPAPFGITIVADRLAAIMVLLAAITGVATAIYSLAEVDAARQKNFYWPLMQVLLAGVCGAFLTGDIFNLYVWFEVLLMSSFVLMALGGERAQLEGSIKYVTLNLFSSIIFLSGAGVLYGAVGTLNMADLALRVAEAADSGKGGAITTVAMMFMVAFGIKAAVFPLFFWLPASYHTPVFAVSAIFAGLLTKVGVYALVRVFTLVFVHDVGYTHTVLLWVAGFTMLSGVLGAASQSEFRRILSFHIVSQIGYMVLGLALFTPLALAGSVFYILHHIIVKANLFFVAGVAHRLRGTSRLDRPGAVCLYLTAPLLAVLFLVPAFSLAGVPPLSGFWAKFVLIRAGLEIHSYVVVAVALFVGLMTLFSMTKIWAEVFWKSPSEGERAAATAAAPLAPTRSAPASMLLPIAGLAILTVCIGFGAQPMLDLAVRTADQLLDRRAYVGAVLGSDDARLHLLDADPRQRVGGVEGEGPLEGGTTS